MASAAAVVGAVSGTVSTINIIKTWVGELLQLLKEYRDVGQTLQSLDLKLAVHQTELGLWMEIWGLQQPTSRRFQRELWGKEPLKTLDKLYVAISSALEETRTDLASILKDAFEIRSSTHTQLGATAIVDFREQAAAAKKQLSPKKIIAFIRKRGPDIQSRLEEVSKWVVTLRNMAIDAYEARHRVSISKTPTQEEIAKAGTSMLLQMALETRYASTGLYQSYRKHVTSKDVRLDVDLISDKAMDLDSVRFRNSVVLQYRFLVPWPSKPQEPLEIMIEGPFDLETRDPNGQLSSEDRGFVEACYAALMNARAEFKIQCRAEIYAFRSRVPLNKIAASNTANLSPLTSLIYELDLRISDEPALYFPRSQRIKLAYKLIQCGLLISGTSWLSKLENKVVTRTRKDKDDDYHFLLELSNDVEMTEDGLLADLSQHLFAVGVLLIELGLGKLVKSLAWENGRSFYPGFVMGDPSVDSTSRSSTVTRIEWQTRLTSLMGDDYTKAAKFCLIRKTGKHWDAVHDREIEPDARETAYVGVLKEYYVRAYLP